MAEDKGSSMLTGLILGAALGAGVTFLFGTKKGKDLREKLREDYPQVFGKIEEFLDDAKDNLSERYQDVLEEVENVREEVEQMSEETKEVVAQRVDHLGKAVESLGEQIQEVSDAHPRRFHRGKRSL